MAYIVKGPEIILPNSPYPIKFDLPIQDVVETHEAFLICLEVSPSSSIRDNVWAFRDDGVLLWRSRIGRKTPYVGLTVESTRSSPGRTLVWLLNRDRTQDLVEASSGRLVEYGSSRATNEVSPGVPLPSHLSLRPNVRLNKASKKRPK